MSNLKYCVTKSETKLFLYGFSTDSLRILYGSAAVSLITFLCPKKLDFGNMRNATRSPDTYFCQIALRILYGFSTDQMGSFFKWSWRG